MAHRIHTNYCPCNIITNQDVPMGISLAELTASIPTSSSNGHHPNSYGLNNGHQNMSHLINYNPDQSPSNNSSIYQQNSQSSQNQTLPANYFRQPSFSIQQFQSSNGSSGFFIPTSSHHLQHQNLIQQHQLNSQPSNQYQQSHHHLQQPSPSMVTSAATGDFHQQLALNCYHPTNNNIGSQSEQYQHHQQSLHQLVDGVVLADNHQKDNNISCQFDQSLEHPQTRTTFIQVRPFNSPPGNPTIHQCGGTSFLNDGSNRRPHLEQTKQQQQIYIPHEIPLGQQQTIFQHPRDSQQARQIHQIQQVHLLQPQTQSQQNCLSNYGTTNIDGQLIISNQPQAATIKEANFSASSLMGSPAPSLTLSLLQFDTTTTTTTNNNNNSNDVCVIDNNNNENNDHFVTTTTTNDFDTNTTINNHCLVEDSYLVDLESCDGQTTTSSLPDNQCFYGDTDADGNMDRDGVGDLEGNADDDDESSYCNIAIPKKPKRMTKKLEKELALMKFVEQYKERLSMLSRKLIGEDSNSVNISENIVAQAQGSEGDEMQMEQILNGDPCQGDQMQPKASAILSNSSVCSNNSEKTHQEAILINDNDDTNSFPMHNNDDNNEVNQVEALNAEGDNQGDHCENITEISSSRSENQQNIEKLIEINKGDSIYDNYSALNEEVIIEQQQQQQKQQHSPTIEMDSIHDQSIEKDRLYEDGPVLKVATIDQQQLISISDKGEIPTTTTINTIVHEESLHQEQQVNLFDNNNNDGCNYNNAIQFQSTTTSCHDRNDNSKLSYESIFDYGAELISLNDFDGNFPTFEVLSSQWSDQWDDGQDANLEFDDSSTQKDYNA